MSFRITGMAIWKILIASCVGKSKGFSHTYLSIVERQESKRNAIGIEEKVAIILVNYNNLGYVLYARYLSWSATN